MRFELKRMWAGIAVLTVATVINAQERNQPVFAAAQAAQPAVAVAYSPGLDTACSLLRSGTIKDDWKAELTARQPEFEAVHRQVRPRRFAGRLG